MYILQQKNLQTKLQVLLSSQFRLGDCILKNLEGVNVLVHWHFHKKLWSITDARTRRVVAHVASLLLLNATCKVSMAGRIRVLRQKRKNVHAWLQGKVAAINFPRTVGMSHKGLRPVKYNPYTAGYFYYVRTKKKATSTPMAILQNNEVFFT